MYGPLGPMLITKMRPLYLRVFIDIVPLLARHSDGDLLVLVHCASISPLCGNQYIQQQGV